MQIAAVTRALSGESCNGDGYLLAVPGDDATRARVAVSDPTAALSKAALRVADPNGAEAAIVAVIDGVGHGSEAAATTERILACMKSNYTLELGLLVRACHMAALHSRGAALGIARVDRSSSRVEFMGVGNVVIQVCSQEPKGEQSAALAAFLRPAGVGLIARGLAANQGIVGYNLPARLLSFSCEYSPGDIVAMCSDGIRRDFDFRCVAAKPALDAAAISDAIVSEFASDADDVTVAVLR